MRNGHRAFPIFAVALAAAGIASGKDSPEPSALGAARVACEAFGKRLATFAFPADAATPDGTTRVRLRVKNTTDESLDPDAVAAEVAKVFPVHGRAVTLVSKDDAGPPPRSVLLFTLANERAALGAGEHKPQRKVVRFEATFELVQLVRGEVDLVQRTVVFAEDGKLAAPGSPENAKLETDFEDIFPGLKASGFRDLAGMFAKELAAVPFAAADRKDGDPPRVVLDDFSNETDRYADGSELEGMLAEVVASSGKLKLVAKPALLAALKADAEKALAGAPRARPTPAFHVTSRCKNLRKSGQEPSLLVTVELDRTRISEMLFAVKREFSRSEARRAEGEPQ
jgi:hypothetical protein